VAIFVHPKDERYFNFVGKKAKVPLSDREVPIIADESADPEKGTGVLMICSYGDKFDVESITKHNLEPRIILGKDGKISYGEHKGLNIKESRKKILGDLKEAGLLKEQKDISNVVNVHDKCGTSIEFIPTEQWFIKLLDKKKELLEQGAKVKWHPEFMKKRYDHWVEGLDWDWSISRERHFGVPLPVWECETCDEVILPEISELPVDPLQSDKACTKCQGVAKGEERVLDTWATSSLTPQIAANLVDNQVEIPFSLRPQAHDIIRTWAFYTIAKAYMHEKKIPWKDIIVSGYVTLGGEKMSKSKGTGVQPSELLEEYGADAIRYWAAGSKLGNDLDYQEKDLVSGKKFLNKIYNASKFVFMNLEDFHGERPKVLEEIDEVFLSKVNELISEATKSFEEYEYSKAKAAVDGFFWNSFADNYLEVVKSRVYNAEGNKKKSAQYVLYQSLLAILKMMAPITPFVTEEIYQTYFKKIEGDRSVHVSSWPTEIEVKGNDEVWNKFIEILGKIRHVKSEAKKSVKAEIKLTLAKDDIQLLDASLEDLKAVTNASEISEGKFKVEFL